MAGRGRSAKPAGRMDAAPGQAAWRRAMILILEIAGVIVAVVILVILIDWMSTAG